MFALYDSESIRMFKTWAEYAGARDTLFFFGLKMGPLFAYARHWRYGEGVNAAGFRVTINGNRATLHTNMPMKNVAQFQPDMQLVRENGLWKLTMLPWHRKRVDEILAELKQKATPPDGVPGKSAPKATSKGLLSNAGWKLHYISSESRYKNHFARYAIDGDPKTFWVSKYKPKPQRHPHTLVIDLGAERTIRGVRYVTRQDGHWQGTISRCEFYVSNSPGMFEKPVATPTFRMTQHPQDVSFPPVRGRYLGIRTLTAFDQNPTACIAEIGVFGE